MLGDVLLIRDMHKSAAESIAKRVLEEREKKPDLYRYIVAISGESGAGKSEVSHSLALNLKQESIRVKILHTDNYYSVPPLLRSEWRRNQGINTVGINEYDWSLINRNIQDFLDERESMMPCIDIIPEQVDKLITDFKKIDLLVIDGLYALKAENIDLRVFIDLTYHETKISQIVRGKENMDDFRLKVLEQEHQNVRSLKPMADLIIDKAYEVYDPKTKKFL
jgi:uridine kinase